MSPVENDRFVQLVMQRFHPRVDEFWGPLAPNVRELALAYSVAGLADSLELAQEGLGRSLLTRFTEEPEGICPPYWPPIGWPPKGGGDPVPGEEEPIVKEFLGASLIYVARFLGSEQLAEQAIEAGNQLIASS